MADRARFVGGPWDGERRVVRCATPYYEVALLSEIEFESVLTSVSEPLNILRAVYKLCYFETSEDVRTGDRTETYVYEFIS